MKFKVSIIIATYNQSEKIKETLKSLINQRFENWECIVADDKSTDGTHVFVKDARIKYFLCPDTVLKGPNGARNYGIQKSTGDLIMSLDSDDLLHENYLQAKVRVFEENPSIDGVLSKTIMINDNKEEINYEKRTKLTDNLLEDFITLKVSWYMHDILWNKEFFKGKMLYNEDLLKMLDRDFHIRRIIEEPKLIFLDEYLAYYRVYGNSNSTNQKIAVIESRHRAVINLILLLKRKNLLTNKMSFYFLKFQIKNIVVLYKSPKCIYLYSELLKHAFILNFKNVIWVLRLFLGYISFKITKRGLIFIK